MSNDWVELWPKCQLCDFIMTRLLRGLLNNRHILHKYIYLFILFWASGYLNEPCCFVPCVLYSAEKTTGLTLKPTPSLQSECRQYCFLSLLVFIVFRHWCFRGVQWTCCFWSFAVKATCEVLISDDFSFCIAWFGDKQTQKSVLFFDVTTRSGQTVIADDSEVCMCSCWCMELNDHQYVHLTDCPLTESCVSIQNKQSILRSTRNRVLIYTNPPFLVFSTSVIFFITFLNTNK